MIKMLISCACEVDLCSAQLQLFQRYLTRVVMLY